MATFTGNDANNTADAVGGVLVGFSGGKLAQLRDAIGDTINGLGGNDFIFGGSGNDIINAGAASDAGTRHDIVIGGRGADTFNVDAENAENTIVIYSFEGGANGITANLETGTVLDTFGFTDTLNGVRFLVATNGIDNLIGSFGDDIIAPGRGSDFVNGNDGNNILAYYFISDGLGGGSDGFDYTSGITVNMVGNDGTVTSADGVNTTFIDISIIVGTQFADTFNGNTGDDNFEGFAGDDVFIGGDGTDLVSYHREYVGGGLSGAFVDLAGNSATDSFGNTDTLTGIEDVMGTMFDDTLLGDGNDNDLQSLQGNDFIRGGAGADIIDAGKAGTGGFRHDIVIGDAGNDTFNVDDENSKTTVLAYAFEAGGAGVTVNLATGTATDTFGNVDTLNGVRFIVATDNNDNLTGSTGDDVLAPGRGATDTVNGNGGTDILAYYFISDGLGGGGDGFTFTAGITVNMTGEDAGGVTGTDGVNTTFTDIDMIAGTRFADVFNGGAGNEDFDGGEGGDAFHGGIGTDRVSFALDVFGGANSGVSVDLLNGTMVDGFGDTDTFDGIENVAGTEFADTLLGDGNDNVLEGLAGNDTLDGRGGADTLIGGDGDDTYTTDGNDTIIDSSGIDTVITTSSATLIDGIENLIVLGGGVVDLTGNASGNTLTGTAESNTLMGLAGSDVLFGGLGRDLLYGGADADRFDFDSVADSVKGLNRDQILDFSHQDDIDLRTIDAKKGAGNQAFKWIGKDAFHHAKGELHYIDKGSACIVQGDVNGDGKADFEIFVKIGSMTKGDFLL
jgi:Ca2+-binding RTX toxin-like protein